MIYVQALWTFLRFVPPCASEIVIYISGSWIMFVSLWFQSVFFIRLCSLLLSSSFPFCLVSQSCLHVYLLPVTVSRSYVLVLVSVFVTSCFILIAPHLVWIAFSFGSPCLVNQIPFSYVPWCFPSAWCVYIVCNVVPCGCVFPCSLCSPLWSLDFPCFGLFSLMKLPLVYPLCFWIMHLSPAT